MMGRCSFDTAIGRCAIAFNANAVTHVTLPGGCAHEGSEDRPPDFAASAIVSIRTLLDGHAVDVSAIPLALDLASAFERRVYDATMTIPRGETRTYGAIAATLGEAGASRAVGVALGRNPLPILIPCHRVLAAGGASGGFTAPGGLDTKFQILRIERAGRPGDGGLFDHLPLMIAR